MGHEPSLLRGRRRRRRRMKVAIIHYWLVKMRGGEKVLEHLCRLFPDADIFTHVHDPAAISPTIARHRITTTFIDRLPLARRLYQKYLPLMPRALEALDLSGYDLVISSESGPAKGVIPPPEAPHLCYCHSPMRYLWDQYPIYHRNAGRLTRAAMPGLAHRLRQWDAVSALRVDDFIANSTHVADRIRKYYRREATVVFPPVAVEDFSPAPRDEIGDFYLWAGELAPYKRPDIAVDAFARLGRRLVVIGDGQGLEPLRRRAPAHVTFLGPVPFDTLRWHLARCQALIYPGEEDFGIVPVEAMASGRPVIAYGRGGALDTVKDGETGLLFETQGADGLAEAVQRFEAELRPRLSPARIAAHAAQFNGAAFARGIRARLAEHGIEPAILPAEELAEAAE